MIKLHEWLQTELFPFIDQLCLLILRKQWDWTNVTLAVFADLFISIISCTTGIVLSQVLSVSVSWWITDFFKEGGKRRENSNL